MIRARATNGWFVLGFTAKDLAAMKDGPLKVELAPHGGKDTVILVYGQDNEEIYETLRQISGGPLPKETAEIPPEGG